MQTTTTTKPWSLEALQRPRGTRLKPPQARKDARLDHPRPGDQPTGVERTGSGDLHGMIGSSTVGFGRSRLRFRCTP